MAQSSAVIILVLILGPVMPQYVWDVFFVAKILTTKQTPHTVK